MLNQSGRQNVQVQNRINDAKALLEKVKNQGLNSSLDSSFDSDISGFPDKPDDHHWIYSKPRHAQGKTHLVDVMPFGQSESAPTGRDWQSTNLQAAQ